MPNNKHMILRVQISESMCRYTQSDFLHWGMINIGTIINTHLNINYGSNVSCACVHLQNWRNILHIVSANINPNLARKENRHIVKFNL